VKKEVEALGRAVVVGGRTKEEQGHFLTK